MPLKTIDYDMIAILSPTVKKRRSTRIDWLKLLLRIYKTNREEFNLIYNRYIELSAYNSQTISLEGLVNDNFVLNSPATIIDGDFIEATYIGIRGEQFIEPTYIFNRSEGIQETYIYNRGEKEAGFSFYIILDPSDLGQAEAIRALVNQFKSGGRTFDIISA